MDVVASAMPPAAETEAASIRDLAAGRYQALGEFLEELRRDAGKSTCGKAEKQK